MFVKAYRKKEIPAGTLIRDNKALMNWSIVKLESESKKVHEDSRGGILLICERIFYISFYLY